MQKRVLLLDNNDVWQDVVIQAIRSLGGDIRIWRAYSISDGYKTAMENTIDVFIVNAVLDDGQDDGEGGMTFAGRIRECDKYLFAPIIILGGSKSQVMDIFHEYHCYDYIEKPYNIEGLKKIVSGALKYTTPEAGKKFIYVKQNSVLAALKCRDIVYMRMEDRILHVYTADGKIYDVYYKSCAQILEEAGCPFFFQCSRNSIINLNHIRSIGPAYRQVFMSNGDSVDIGVTFVKLLKRIL